MLLPTEHVDIQWGVQIPLRDGVSLNATLYSPGDLTEPLPVIVTLTPYISQTYHHEAMYFASQRFRFMIVDVRGRGNSQGGFRRVDSRKGWRWRVPRAKRASSAWSAT
jgi:predicted acyl esterase